MTPERIAELRAAVEETPAVLRSTEDNAIAELLEALEAAMVIVDYFPEACSAPLEPMSEPCGACSLCRARASLAQVNEHQEKDPEPPHNQRGTRGA